MQHLRASLLTCTGIFALSATAAQASVDEYSAGAGASVSVNLEVCSAETQLAVRGDGGTDLDFVVTDPSGDVVHTDTAVDDYISVVLEKSSSGCGTYNLAVNNLGDESNAFTVVLEPILESSTRIEKYVIQANETQTLNLKACGTSAKVTARGDGDTDLDYVIRNSDGAVVHENDDTTDETNATLSGLRSDCEVFEMDIANLGQVYNAVMVVTEPEGISAAAFDGTPPSTSLASGLTGVSTVAESEGPGEYRADANATITVNLPVCGASRMEIRGDGDTDLDFTIRNSNNDTVHYDADLSDITFTTLEPLGECETFTAEVSNLGDVYNVFTIALTDADADRPVSGAGEYRVQASAATKVPLRVCSLTNVFVRGDGDTDIDFDVTDEGGDNVHSNYDYTDQTQFTLDPGEACADYSLFASNLGEVFNDMTITMDDGPDVEPLPEVTATAEDAVEAAVDAAASSGPAEVIGSGPGEYRAPASTAVRVELPVCEETFLSIEGDGDTDLDFLINESDGTTVHSDYDLTDRTYTSLKPAEGCETYDVRVDNLGSVYNDFTIKLSQDASDVAPDIPPPAVAPTPPIQIRPDPAPTPPSSGSETLDTATATATEIDVPEDTASTDGNNRNIAILNRTGDTIFVIHWSNSATLEWGDDRLGESTLADGQQWNVNTNDGSNACLFDFKAVTGSARTIEVTRVNVCEVTSVAFE